MRHEVFDGRVHINEQREYRNKNYSFMRLIVSEDPHDSSL